MYICKCSSLVLIFPLLMLSPVMGAAKTSVIVSDTLAHPEWLPVGIGLGLIGAGCALNHSAFEQRIQQNLHARTGPDFQVQWDDYLQWSPVLEMYIGDLSRMPGKDHWFDQTKYLVMADLLSTAITYGLKKATHKIRPNGGLESWPSGHTTFAFTNATVLFEEYRAGSPWLAGSGYLLASGTGFLRMLNNKHWFSDVLAGAGIGMLSATCIYRVKPLKRFNPFIKSKQMSILPWLGYHSISGYFVCRF